jgi:hypothetical protein
MKYLSIKISVLIIVLAAFNSCELEPDTPPITEADPDMFLSVADIYQIHADSGDNYVFNKDYMLFATVTMDDSNGNIYKEAYVQDSTDGINLYRLSTAGLTRVGQKIRINLNGASIVDYSGKMEIVFDGILDASKNIIVQDNNAAIEPAEISISDLETNDYECKLVKIMDVQFADSELGKTYADAINHTTQNRILVDCNGNELTVRTSGYADFAADTVADGRGSIVGIATTFIGYTGTVTRQLIIRSIEEVRLDSTRCNN